MAANYRPMLELADELALLQRYLGPQEEKQCGLLESAFNDERRIFVYELIKDERLPEDHVAIIDRDLDRISETGNHYDFAIQHVRDQLHLHVARQLNSSRLVQVATRWGPPFAILIVTCLLLYIRS